MSSRPTNRKKRRKRRLGLTGDPLLRKKRERIKKKFLGTEPSFEAWEQEYLEELLALLRELNGGRKIHDPKEWIHDA